MCWWHHLLKTKGWLLVGGPGHYRLVPPSIGDPSAVGPRGDTSVGHRERRNGVRPADLKFGTKVTVTGHPMKDGRPGALWMKAVRDDGKEFYPAGRRGGTPTQ